MEKKKYSEIEVQLIADNLIGKTFGEINNYEVKTYKKGSFGHIIETDVYEYEINPFSEPDFLDAGIELKVTPYKVNKNKTLSAKERLVLNIINYMDEYKNDFYSSHFYYKNKKIQIVWYLNEEGKQKNDFKITHQLLFTFPEEDLNIIIDDWNIIINKIKDGKAHELSEADTMYLGACTKGANSKSTRKQPFSPIEAMQRAFCLKISYMTQLVRKHIGGYEDVEKILDNVNISFTQYVENIIKQYEGKTQKELMASFNINSTAKSVNSMIISRMFGINSKLGQTDEFLKANIVPRTIRVQKNGRIKESMPFPAFKYIEIIEQNWENSELKEELETTKYMFFIFKENGDDYIFKGIKLWNMPEMIIESSVKKMWLETKNVILKGNIVKDIVNGKRITNFPGMKNNKFCHVRPHAQNSKDTYRLPIPDKNTNATKYTKHCFWINNTYLEEILSDYLY